jgi:hypothetical protein
VVVKGHTWQCDHQISSARNPLDGQRHRWMVCMRARIKFLCSFNQNTDSSSFKLVWSLSSDDFSSNLYVLLFHACLSQQPEGRHGRREIRVTLLVGSRAYFQARGTVQDLAVCLCKECEPGVCHPVFPTSPIFFICKTDCSFLPRAFSSPVRFVL